MTHECNENRLESRVGVIDATDGYRYHVAGCTPRKGDWVRVAWFDTLVLKVDDEGFVTAFPYFRARPRVGDQVEIVGYVQELVEA